MKREEKVERALNLVGLLVDLGGRIADLVRARRQRRRERRAEREAERAANRPD